MRLDNYGRILGMDLSKRTSKVCILTKERNFEDRTVVSGSMTPEGRRSFISALRKDDIVAIEGGTSSSNFAREIQEAGVKLFLLNPGKLHIIFQSQVKTDRQDCVKIARYIRDTAEESIVAIDVPSLSDSNLREILNSYDFAKKQRTMLVNKLHSIFNMNGFPSINKKDLEGNASRIGVISTYLSGIPLEDACMVESAISLTEASIDRYKDMMREALVKEPGISLPWLSIPGVGLLTAASILAYVGDGKRFYSPKQLRNYVGLVPRIDQSGDRCRIGGVWSYGCKPIRKNIVQAGWSFDHRKSDCPLKEEWDSLVGRHKRKQTAAIHIANKTLTIGWTLQKKHELYNGFGDYSYLKRKLRSERLEAIDTSSFPELH